MDKKKKKKWFFCVCLPPRKKDGRRPRYYLLKTKSFKTALKLYALKCLKLKKIVFKKKYLMDKYYYYDGQVYIERLMNLSKVNGLEGKDIYSTGYFHELCRECTMFALEKKRKRKRKKKKEK